MITRAYWEYLRDLMANDTGSLNQATNALRVYLIAASFNPATVNVPGDVTPATFTGGTFLEAGVGPPNVYHDPLSGKWYIEPLEPAGGWEWICTVTPGAPETIYGLYLGDHANAVMFGSQIITPNLVISAAGDAVVVNQVRFEAIFPQLIF